MSNEFMSLRSAFLLRSSIVFIGTVLTFGSSAPKEFCIVAASMEPLSCVLHNSINMMLLSEAFVHWGDENISNRVKCTMS